VFQGVGKNVASQLGSPPVHTPNPRFQSLFGQVFTGMTPYKVTLF